MLHKQMFQEEIQDILSKYNMDAEHHKPEDFLRIYTSKPIEVALLLCNCSKRISTIVFNYLHNTKNLKQLSKQGPHNKWNNSDQMNEIFEYLLNHVGELKEKEDISVERICKSLKKFFINEKNYNIPEDLSDDVTMDLLYAIHLESIKDGKQLPKVRKDAPINFKSALRNDIKNLEKRSTTIETETSQNSEGDKETSKNLNEPNCTGNLNIASGTEVLIATSTLNDELKTPDYIEFDQKNKEALKALRELHEYLEIYDLSINYFNDMETYFSQKRPRSDEEKYEKMKRFHADFINIFGTTEIDSNSSQYQKSINDDTKFNNLIKIVKKMMEFKEYPQLDQIKIPIKLKQKTKNISWDQFLEEWDTVVDDFPVLKCLFPFKFID
eukprot:gene2340-2808_t